MRTRPLRVLHVVPGLTRGGAERFLERLVRAHAHAVSSSVISLQGEGELASALRMAGASVRALDLGHRARIGAILPHRRRIDEVARPDIVQGWLHAGNLAATVLGHALERPALWNVRSTATDDAWPLRTSLFERASRVLPPPRHVVCVSDGARRYAERTWNVRGRTVVIENGFDEVAFAFDQGARDVERRALGLADDTPVLVAVMRFSPEKDAPTLLDAFSRVRRALPRAVLLLVGQGQVASNAALMTHVAAADRAHVVPLGAREDVARVLSAADVFVSASRLEGMPNALAEALLVERVAVATDVGDTARFRSPGLSLVPPRAPVALADAVIATLALSARERAHRGALSRAHVVLHFSMERAARRYLSLWEDCHVRHRGSP